MNARLRPLVGLCAAAVVLAMPAPALATTAGGPTGMVTADAATTPDAIAQVSAYWTPQRMAAARPAPIPRYGLDQGTGRGRFSRTPELFGPQPGQAAPLAGGFPWDGFPAAPIAQRTGKLFFTLPSGSNAYCTASVVSSENRDLVWTAGHCVYDSGAFVTNVVFAPFYHDDIIPYGTWTARQLRVPPTYANGSRPRSDDVGAVVLNTGGTYGLHVADHVGSLAIAFFQPTSLFVYNFGFPAQPFLLYDGRKLVYCLGNVSNILPGLTPPILRSECDMREGSSGGPFTAYFNGFFGTVIAVNSHYVLTDPPGAYLYGAYHDQAARDLFEQARYV